MRIGIPFALLVWTVSAAYADDEPKVSGVVVYGAGAIEGEVKARDGAPLGGVEVHVVASSGREQVVTTDQRGRYRIARRVGEYALVFVNRDARIGARTATPTKIGDEEVIEVREAVPPAVMPKARATAVVPPYSEAAIDHNVWGRTWLLLDVDARGAVTRIKSLVPAGHDLDRNAWREAFALDFEPARDRAGRPTRALMLWSYEWPSYWWMTEHTYPLSRLPSTIAKVPCRGTGPSSGFYRDCRQADMARVFTAPWIERTR